MGADTDKNTATPVITVFLSGSRKITRLNDLIRERLREIMGQGFTVIIGDANGADKAMQTYLADNEYSNVAVYFAGGTCRNNLGSWTAEQIRVDPRLKGRAVHTEKDKAMAAKADYGLVLWDGKSAGSITNVCELLKLGKRSKVYFSGHKEFFSVANVEDIKKILSYCELSDVRELENSPILKQQMSILSISSQQSFDL